MQIINEIREALQLVTNQKLLGDDLPQAIKLARAANKLCDTHKEQPAVEPYRALAAYRLALLLMRQDAPLKLSTLEEIDDLLVHVQRHNYMGPWPYLYRMAVLSHLRQHPSHTDMCNRKLSDCVREASLKLLPAYDQDKSVLGGKPITRDLDFPLLVQSHLFNALELACFFSGFKYSSLQGTTLAILSQHLEADSGYSVTSASIASIDSSIDPRATDWVMVTLTSSTPPTPSLAFPRPIIERDAALTIQAATESKGRLLLLMTSIEGELDLPKCKMTSAGQEHDVGERFKGMPIGDLTGLLFGNTSAESTETPATRRGPKPESKKRSLARRRKKLAELFGNAISFTDGKLRLTGDSAIVLTISSGAWSSLIRTVEGGGE